MGLAADARRHGNHPFGALLANADGDVILTAENTVLTNHDVTAHAEINLVRLASRESWPTGLGGLTLYTSTEPCPMCAGAIYWSGLRAVVYALSQQGLDEVAGGNGEDSLLLSCRDVFAAGGRVVQVSGPFDLPEARAVHEGFWS